LQLLTLSAKTPAALDAATANLAAHLQRHPELNLADVAYTLQTGRSNFSHRRVVICGSTDEAASILETPEPGKVYDNFEEANQRPSPSCWGGVGDHYRDMARGLYETEPTFRATIDECCELLQPVINLDLRTLIFSPDSPTSTTAAGSGIDLRRMLGRSHSPDAAGSTSPEAEQLQQTRYAQPAVFVLEYALSQLLISWGIRPSALIGYSLGEYVCATLAGVFRLEDALSLVARRAELIEGVERGAMLAVALPESEVRELLGEGLSIAIINSPQLCVVAGAEARIADWKRRWRRRK
jgi:acyl transferase domain-containing protein